MNTVQAVALIIGIGKTDDWVAWAWYYGAGQLGAFRLFS